MNGACHDGAEAWWAWPLEFAERACCCPARPVAVVVMPPTAGRPYPVELLLCTRHYQVSVSALIAAGATVYDAAGVVIQACGVLVPGRGNLRWPGQSRTATGPG